MDAMQMQDKGAPAGGPEDQEAPEGSPQDVLNKARQMLFSQDMQPIVEKALTNAKDLAIGVAMVLAPVLLRISQETDIDDDELLGNDQGDGIAVYLIGDLFDAAAEAGIPGAEDRAMAEKAAQTLDQMLGKLFAQDAQAGAPQGTEGAPQGPPAPQGIPPAGPPPGALMIGG